MKCAYLSTCSKPDPKPKNQKTQHENMIPKLQAVTGASEAESGTSQRKTQLPKCTNIPLQMITFSCLLMSPFYILQFTQNPECKNCTLLSIFQSADWDPRWLSPPTHHCHRDIRVALDLWRRIWLQHLLGNCLLLLQLWGVRQLERRHDDLSSVNLVDLADVNNKQ